LARISGAILLGSNNTLPSLATTRLINAGRKFFPVASMMSASASAGAGAGAGGGAYTGAGGTSATFCAMIFGSKVCVRPLGPSRFNRT